MPTSPVEWMPGLWDALDTNGWPLRHRPARRHGDLWAAKCGVWAFEFRPVSVVVDRCQSCAACELVDEQEGDTVGLFGNRGHARIDKAEAQFAAGKLSYSELVAEGNQALAEVQQSCAHKNTETEDGKTYCSDCTAEL